MKLTQSPDRKTVSVREAAAILGIGVASAYAGVRSGRIPSLKISERRIVVPMPALERMLAAEASAT